jgi:hypothetical protein
VLFIFSCNNCIWMWRLSLKPAESLIQWALGAIPSSNAARV